MSGVDFSFESNVSSKQLSSAAAAQLRVKAARTTDEIFESFSRSRKFSRNCMWVSLLLLLVSIGAKLVGQWRRLEDGRSSLVVVVVLCAALAAGRAGALGAAE